MDRLITYNLGIIAARQVIFDVICQELLKYHSVKSAITHEELHTIQNSVPVQTLESTQHDDLECFDPLFHVCKCSMDYLDVKENFSIMSSEKSIQACLSILELLELQLGKDGMDKLLQEGLTEFISGVRTLTEDEVIPNLVFKDGLTEALWFNTARIPIREVEELLYDQYRISICTSEDYVKGVA